MTVKDLVSSRCYQSGVVEMTYESGRACYISLSSINEEDLRADVYRVEEFYYESGDRKVTIYAYMEGDQKR